MIGTVTVEAHYSATYVENYLDAVENLPDDVQRHLSRIRELDVLYRSHLRDVNQYYEQWTLNQPQNGTTAAAALNSTASTNGPGPDATPAHPEPSSGPSSSSSSSSSGSTEQSNVLRRAIARIQQSLIAAQELGDEKLQIVQQLQDLIDHKTRQLDQDYLHLGKDFFASIREQSRDESNRLIDGIGSDRYQAAGTGAAAANNGPGQYGAPGNGSGHGGPGNGNGGAGLVGSNPHLLQHTSNGTALGGIAGGHQGGGAGGASGMYSGNNGGGGGGVGLMGNERSSKRARRTRNEQSGAANGAGSNTPNSTCGASPMDIDSSIDSVGGLPGPGVLGGLGGSGESIGMALSVAGGNGGKQDVASGSLGAGAGSSSGSGNNGSGGNGTMNGGNGSGGASGAGSGGHNSNVSGLSGRDGQGGGNSTAIGSGGGKGAAGSNGGNGQNSTSNNNGGATGASGSGGAPAGGGTGSQSSGSNQGGGGGKKGNSGGGGGGSAGGSGGGGGGSGSGTGAATSGKKKKRKAAGSGRGSQAAREAREETPAAEETVDPDEPTYCLCDQISFGEMILCDNDLCPIEWFHFSCVSLISKPKGRWFCPKCRGDRPNVMKPKAQFLKELERYNKEKEEKT